MARLKGRATLIFSQLLGNYAILTFGMERSSHCSSLITYWDNSENFVTEQMEYNGFQSTVCDRSTQIFRMLGLLFFFWAYCRPFAVFAESLNQYCAFSSKLVMFANIKLVEILWRKCVAPKVRKRVWLASSFSYPPNIFHLGVLLLHLVLELRPSY